MIDIKKDVAVKGTHSMARTAFAVAFIVGVIVFFTEPGRNAVHAAFDSKPKYPPVISKHSEKKDMAYSSLHTPMDASEAPYKPLYSPIWDMP